jgi:HEAT repeat protein
MVLINEFQPYLEGIRHRYKQWWTLNALTEAIAARQATFSFEQVIQTEEKNSEGKPQKVTLSIFNGIRSYIESEHILLVGSPGVGKSALLLQCLLYFAETELEKPNPRIPVLVELKEYTTDRLREGRSGILALIKDVLRRQLIKLRPRPKIETSDIEKLLDEERLILLLDGLNEMPTDIYRTHLIAFREEYEQIPLICSTRGIDAGDLGIKRKFEIQPLKSSEIDRFLQECIPNQKQKVLQLLNRDNRELSRTPFILWLLYDLFQRQGLEVETLAEAFRQFFGSFQKEGTPVSDERRKDWKLWLEHLAFTMLNSSEPNDPGLVISIEQAEQFLKEKFGELYNHPSRIEELLKYHLLERVAEKKVSFHHQLIQEYYAAECLLPKLSSLFKEQSNQEYTPLQKQYLNCWKWTEAIALMMGLRDIADDQVIQLVELALRVDQRIGAKLAGAARKNLRSQTIDLIDNSPLPTLIKIRLLSLTQSEEAVLRLSKILNSQGVDHGVRSTAIDSIADIGGELAISCLVQSLTIHDSTLRSFIYSSLGRISEKFAIPSIDIKSYISPYLYSRITQTQNQIPLSELIDKLKNGNVESRFASAFIIGKRGEKQAIPALLKQLQDEDWQVVQSVVNALGKIAGIEALPYLYKLQSSDILNFNLSQDITNAIAAIQSRCGFYNYEIAKSFSPGLLNQKILEQIKNVQGVTNVTNNFNFDQRGAAIGVNVANKGSNVRFIQHAKQNINISEQDLTEAAQKIQSLLNQLAQTYPTTTETQQQTFVQKFLERIESTPDLIKIILTGGIEGLKTLCPPAGIPIEVIRSLYEVIQKRYSQS